MFTPIVAAFLVPLLIASALVWPHQRNELVIYMVLANVGMAFVLAGIYRPRLRLGGMFSGLALALMAFWSFQFHTASLLSFMLHAVTGVLLLIGSTSLGAEGEMLSRPMQPARVRRTSHLVPQRHHA